MTRIAAELLVLLTLFLAGLLGFLLLMHAICAGCNLFGPIR